MANKNVVFDETKAILELMEESEEKIYLLLQDLKQNQKVCEQAKLEVGAVHELKVKKSTDLEEYQAFKCNIKEYNEKLVNLAQQIYSCGQQLYMDVNLRENELDEIEKTFNKNEEKYLDKLNKYEVEKEKLKGELELIRRQNAEEEEMKKMETQNLQAENGELNSELNRLNEEIEKCEQRIEKNEISDQELKYKEEIGNIKERLKLIDDDFSKTTVLLSEIDENMQLAEADAQVLSSEMDEMITKYHNEAVAAMEKLDTYKLEYDDLINKMESIKCMDREREVERRNEMLKEVEVAIREDYEMTEQKIHISTKMYVDQQELITFRKQVKQKLVTDIDLIKTKLDTAHDELNRILADVLNIQSKMSNVNLNDILEARRAELGQLKTTRHELKEQYNEKATKAKIETTNLNAEIEDIQTKNRELQQAIDALESEIGQMETAKDSEMKEKLRLEGIHRQLEAEVSSLTSQLSNIALAPPRIKRKLVGEPSKVSTKVSTGLKQDTSGTFEKKPKKERHWDSDSSVEGEDRRFSEMAKQKIRMRKVHSNKP